jgi:hypothetical protein
MSKRKKKPAMERTTISLPVGLKRAAQAYALEQKCDLQDLIAQGLEQIVPKKVVIYVSGGAK